MRRLEAHAGDTPTCVLFRAQEAHAEICFFPVIFRVAIGKSESRIEKRQVEKCKVLPLQGAGGGASQGQNAAIQEEKEHEAGRQSKNKKQCTRRNIPEFTLFHFFPPFTFFVIISFFLFMADAIWGSLAAWQPYCGQQR